MHEPPIQLVNNIYISHSSCIAYNFAITDNIANYIHEPPIYFTNNFFNKFHKEPPTYTNHRLIIFLSPLFFMCIKYDSWSHACRLKINIIYVRNTNRLKILTSIKFTDYVYFIYSIAGFFLITNHTQSCNIILFYRHIINYIIYHFKIIRGTSKTIIIFIGQSFVFMYSFAFYSSSFLHK